LSFVKTLSATGAETAIYWTDEKTTGTPFRTDNKLAVSNDSYREPVLGTT